MDTSKAMWEALVIRGIAGILFGLAAVFWPGLTLVVLVYIFSIYILISGIVGVVQAVVDLTRKKSWFLPLLLGIAEVGVGLYLVRHPQVSFATFILLGGLIFIVRGVFEVVMAVTEAENATNKMLLIIGGVLSVLVGVVLLLQPVASGVAFVWVLGLYALITGPVMIALAVDAKRVAEGHKK